jgi:hypothetical protein
MQEKNRCLRIMGAAGVRKASMPGGGELLANTGKASVAAVNGKTISLAIS